MTTPKRAALRTLSPSIFTFIDSDDDDVMFIYHFVSERQDTPTDPAGKFAEALSAMIKTLDSGTSKILETSGG